MEPLEEQSLKLQAPVAPYLPLWGWRLTLELIMDQCKLGLALMQDSQQLLRYLRSCATQFLL